MKGCAMKALCLSYALGDSVQCQQKFVFKTMIHSGVVAATCCKAGLHIAFHTRNASGAVTPTL